MSKLVLEKEFKLPKGWCSSKTIDVMKIIDYRGRTPPYVENGIHHIRSANIKNGKIIWKKIKFVSEETYQKYMTRGIPKEGDILLTTEAPLGEVTLIPKEKFCLAQRLILLRCNEIIFHKFMLYQIMSPNFQRYLTGKKTGTVVTGISSKNFKSLETLIPPLPEQKRIISKIESIFTQIDAGKEKLGRVKVLLKQCKQSVLRDAFEGKLVSQDPNYDPVEILLKRMHKDSNKLFLEKDNIPRGWVKTNLENICELIGGGTPPRQNLEYFDGGILWLTPTEIPKNKIVKIYDSREKITALGLKKSSAKIIPKNSVLLTSRPVLDMLQ